MIDGQTNERNLHMPQEISVQTIENVFSDKMVSLNIGLVDQNYA